MSKGLNENRTLKHIPAALPLQKNPVVKGDDGVSRCMGVKISVNKALKLALFHNPAQKTGIFKIDAPEFRIKLIMARSRKLR